ncbi:hypothetical protein [Actinomadura rupiterrae]|uniref:hypothetical protein n=1 Tax=Actinomadura rupiterrae TaxID=559627 RepID=UPI0020A32C28|nr:hypothetical protein [Actinomadura rupiterrae]MCP2340278.1 hypothetical protein [Actinomadura rupiterrae]
MAQATMWCAVPSGIWRILFALRLPAGFTGSSDPARINFFGLLGYVCALTLLSETLAFLSMGLVRSWGEVWPRWVPFLRGRRVHPLAAIIPAGAGAIGLMLLWTPLAFGVHFSDPEYPHGVKMAILYLCYLPLVAWGPLLALLTGAYAYRRYRY